MTMDTALYLTSAQDRVFLALGGLLAAFVFDLIRGALWQNRGDPRPVAELIIDTMAGIFARRLNRRGRANAALVMRGVLVLGLVTVLWVSIVAAGYMMCHATGYGGLFLSGLVALSVGTMSWFWPLRALSKSIDNPNAPRPYFVLSRASYTNLVSSDPSGIIRVSCTAAIRSLNLRLVAPLTLFILFDWQILALYWPVMTLALMTGEDGLNRNFAFFANVFGSLFLLPAAFVMIPIMLVSLLLSAGASFFRSLPSLFSVRRWPKLLQGGVPVLMAAYAMNLTLGGPRQDRQGNPVAAAWAGSDKATAKFESRDIGRVLYLQCMTLLIVAVSLYGLTII